MAKPMYYWNGTAWEAVAPVVPQSPIAYQASAPSSPSTGDLWIDSDQDLDSYQRQLVRYRFNPSAGATSVSGTDANGATLSYTPGAEQVYLNGALLVRGSDYVATNGTSITSLAALSSGDVLEVFAYVAFNPANTYTQSQVDGKLGLVHLKTETFSNASTVSINNVFSSTYDNYRILFSNMTCATSDQGLSFRLRASGTDFTGSNYEKQEINGNGTSVGASRASGNSLNIGTISPSLRNSITMDLMNPYLAVPKTGHSHNMYTLTGTGTLVRTMAHVLNTSSAYDGFTFFAGTNITGTVQVYGYKQ